MTQPAEGAIAEIINVLKTVSGVQNVPLNPPSVMSYKTFGLVYPGSGNYNFGSPTGTKRGLHNISVDILTVNMDIARCIAEMKPYIDTVALALGRQVSYDSDGNPGQQFNASIETFESLDYLWVPAGTDYGGVQVVGLHFTLNQVKILTSL
jgi:hypothetical protein